MESGGSNMQYIMRNLYLSLDENEEDIKRILENKVNSKIHDLKIVKKAIDARKGNISFVYSVAFSCDKKIIIDKNISIYVEESPYFIPKVSSNIRPIVVGFGPCGLFAALYLARANLRPIIIEQGKDVDSRAIDIELMKHNGVFNPHSNVCYGEGGAGTFSDGKLNTGIKDERIKFCLEEFYKHGAKKEILYSAKPHIGSDYLPKIVKSMREEISSLGGEIWFETKLSDIVVDDNRITSIIVESKQKEIKIKCSHVILAIGHSARDTYKMLYERNVNMRPKPFSIGVRIEHKQSELNKSQYKKYSDDLRLPPSDYKLVAHLDSKRVLYTFCMCPGGEVVASNTLDNTIVTNGMSLNSRSKENANSALLVNVDVNDYYCSSPLDGIQFQEKYEKKAYNSLYPYCAPIQLVGDFLNKRTSTSIRSVKPSYLPGTYFANFWDILPKFVCEALQDGLKVFQNKISCFKNKDAVLTGVETRSSSPLIIERDEKHESNIVGLFPSGEGSGYSGGIMSSAVDGLKTAEIVLKEIIK